MKLCNFFTENTYSCKGIVKKPVAITALLFLVLSLTACGNSASVTALPDYTSPEAAQVEQGQRDNTPQCLVPSADGTVIFENEEACIDASNASEGYVMVRYLGESEKVKLQITGNDGITYTYDLYKDSSDFETFPLSSGSGHYQINIYTVLSGNEYALAHSAELDTTLRDEFLPFLYPNQYVRFEEGSEAVKQAQLLAKPANNDLEVITNVYDYIIANLTYDYDKAENVQSGYLPDADSTLASKTGICLDYSSLMTAMLRSQRIPTRMEIGYAGTAYHAWISTYIDEVGWVNGIIQFDGTEWSMMDPTFATTESEREFKSFFSDSDNYRTKYIY